MIGKLFALAASCVLSLVLLEGGLRLFLDPLDFLKPEVVLDEVVGWRIIPGSAGHDDWGYRNEGVPETAEIVAIGDSQTYGYSASASESWPAWLSQLTGKTVYNLGIGGYGPAEYRYLLEARALRLSPKVIVVGVYLGNDLFDANQSISNRPYWSGKPASDNESPGDPLGADRDEPRKRKTTLSRVRDWLRHNSMLLRVVEESAVGQALNAIGDRESDEPADCRVETHEPFPTVFKLADRFQGLDPSRDDIRAGLDSTLDLLGEMAQQAEAHGAELVVVLIPTKESVIAPNRETISEPCESLYRSLVAAERAASEEIESFLDERGIRWVDPLGLLSELSTRERIYLRSGDSHPNAVGYRAIAEAVAGVVGG